ncbi:uncharacterized protein [Oryctolagus cuniculus]|uniref:uncharacterized protein isoform X2 n=1 Tax=Oryctolagus cuniculus TaxID=9986 RepID=UPI0038796230
MKSLKKYNTAIKQVWRMKLKTNTMHKEFQASSVELLPSGLQSSRVPPRKARLEPGSSRRGSGRNRWRPAHRGLHGQWWTPGRGGASLQAHMESQRLWLQDPLPSLPLPAPPPPWSPRPARLCPDWPSPLRPGGVATARAGAGAGTGLRDEVQAQQGADLGRCRLPEASARLGFRASNTRSQDQCVVPGGGVEPGRSLAVLQ